MCLQCVASQVSHHESPSEDLGGSSATAPDKFGGCCLAPTNMSLPYVTLPTNSPLFRTHGAANVMPNSTTDTAANQVAAKLNSCPPELAAATLQQLAHHPDQHALVRSLFNRPTAAVRSTDISGQDQLLLQRAVQATHGSHMRQVAHNSHQPDPNHVTGWGVATFAFEDHTPVTVVYAGTISVHGHTTGVAAVAVPAAGRLRTIIHPVPHTTITVTQAELLQQLDDMITELLGRSCRTADNMAA